QDVPISVSAFDAAALDAKQIDNFSDLQFNVPNVSFSKGNFGGSNFQIRGIGTLLTASSGDSGVAIHVNDVYLQAPRLLETEYYDMEQVEILRGPQGTLFGRNSTGGAVNAKTAKPVLGETTASAEVQAGNYAHRRAKGHINLPLGEDVAVRLAGIVLDREGYTENLLTGNDVDDRSQFSGRASLRWEASDRTTIDLMASYFEEDSSRTRSQKQFCDQDPSGVLGCLPTTRQTGSLNGNATLGQLFASNLFVGLAVSPALSGLGAFDVFAPLSDGNPDDVREISAFFDPEYQTDETLLIATIEHDWNDWLSSTAILSYQETSLESRMDYNGTADPTNSVSIPVGFCETAPAACQFFGVENGGPLWFSTVPDPTNGLGAIDGTNFVLDSTGAARDNSGGDSEQMSAELRFTTSLDGPWNFLVSGYYLDYEATEGDYVVQASGLDYGNVLLGTLGGLGAGAITDPTVAFGNAGLSYFNSYTNRFNLESFAFFGEAYYDVSETVKLTFGLRYSEDTKSLTDNQYPLLGLDALLLTGIDGSNTYIGPDGSVTPVTGLQQLLQAGVEAGGFDGDPSTPGFQLYRDDEDTFDAVTGRFVIDWAADLPFTDETLLYASYSIGFKSGGLNPPVDASLFGSTPARFENEEIGAWEIGAKNTLFDGRMQANLNLFYYDYGDLQIGKIVNRTSLNENTDATIYGFEGEFVFAPTEKWLFNTTIAGLKTELGDTETVDPRDPSQGRDDVTVIKDAANASNCAVARGAGAPLLSDNFPLIGAIVGEGGFFAPTDRDLGVYTGGAFAGQSLPATPGVSESGIGICDAIGDAIASDPAFAAYEYLPSGQTVNLDGNSLINAPELTVNIGAQYTHTFGNGMYLTGRVDYYWQDEFYTTAFNRQQDLIDAWDVINAQVTLTSANEKWYVRVFGQNIGDEDNIVGAYQTDPSSGLFTNAFFNEPRLYGATLGVNL
ncbi:MAG: TonB-dependent receptor, partial [Pseudomonadales bacterium]|nr:TonB-dependent receptor [Pseudomonadales bacterium]